jgi:REP element-mobilizing transposase RayT
MPHDPLKGHSALRRGRDSRPHATYFITFGTVDKRGGLHSPDLAEIIWSEIHALESSGDWILRCAVIMPDHIHLLITLGARLTLSQTVQRLKSKTVQALLDYGLRWASGYYDHRLRPEDGELAVFLYIYLNPYRGELIASDQTWPQYRCRPEDWAWLHTQLDADLPPAEWLL